MNDLILPKGYDKPVIPMYFVSNALPDAITIPQREVWGGPRVNEWDLEGRVKILLQRYNGGDWITTSEVYDLLKMADDYVDEEKRWNGVVGGIFRVNYGDPRWVVNMLSGSPYLTPLQRQGVENARRQLFIDPLSYPIWKLEEKLSDLRCLKIITGLRRKGKDDDFKGLRVTHKFEETWKRFE